VIPSQPLTLVCLFCDVCIHLTDQIRFLFRKSFFISLSLSLSRYIRCESGSMNRWLDHEAFLETEWSIENTFWQVKKRTIVWTLSQKENW
jgi:hypothetical protein